MRERDLNESQKYIIKELLDRANSRGHDKIHNVDELRAAIENQDCKWGQEERITEEDFFDWSMWFYCGKCRQLLDGGYVRLDDLENDLVPLIKEQEEEGIDHSEQIEALKEVKERYPNCKAICWDCLDEYIGRKKAMRALFGMANLASLTDTGLKNALGDCQQKIVGLKIIEDDINTELVRRKEERK